MMMFSELILMIVFLILLFNFNLVNKYFISNMMFIINLMFLTNLNFFNDWNVYGFLMGLNYYSFMLVMLCLWIISLIVLCMFLKDYLLCFNLLMIMLLMLLMNFLSLNIFMFYFMFESSMLFIFYILMKWGLGILRISASYYLLFYTMIFSLPLMVVLFYMDHMFFFSNFMYMELMNKNLKLNNFLLLILILTFLVKLPMWMLHNWLLKAHVEAPVFGSMILASLMLKLGSYGLLRFLMILDLNYMFNLFIYIGLLGGILMSLLCFCQIDMKVLVAMSSVVHMNLLISSMFTMYKLSFIGCYLMMISHGLCSSGMFYMLNLSYLETNSRLLIFNKGLMVFMPSMSLMWFLLCSSNLSAPLSLNLVSEIFMLMGLLVWNQKLIIMLFMYCLFSFMYSLYFFSYINHGNSNLKKMLNVNLMNYLILLMHWIPLNMMIFNLSIMI